MLETMINDINLHNGCSHRLPCGYCVLLGRDCPRQAASTANFASTSNEKTRVNLNKLEGQRNGLQRAHEKRVYRA